MSKIFAPIALLLLVAASTLATDRPNVILIVTDDQGYGDMSCHGNPWLKTPSLDRLATESTRFENYHVDPVCTPTRAALMTGRYSSRVGAWAVTEGRQLLQPDEVTMAEVFSASGYRTGMFGKWHLGDTWPYAPRFRGFQDVVRHLAGGIDEIGNPSGNDYFGDTYYRNGVPEKIDGYCTDVFFSECQRFITQRSDKPFFAYLPLNAMHSPHNVAEAYSAPFRASGHGETRSNFFGQIINFDENLGRLFEFLQMHKLSDNTIVIFMGDNGTAVGFVDRDSDEGYNSGMRGHKGSVYDGGHRVACFARWPGKWTDGLQIKQLTSVRDWLPTLIECCGLNAPEGVRFDGQSLLPLLKEGTDSWPDRTMFVERQRDRPALGKDKSSGNRLPPCAVLTEKWRLVNGELYDITADPGQQKDLRAKHPNIARDLRSQYEQYFSDVFSSSTEYARFQLGADQESPTRLTVRDWHPTKGNVIWKQEQLSDDGLAINGFWAVNVQKAGRYAFRLTRFPDDAPAAMKAAFAKLEVGDQTQSKSVSPNATEVIFETKLSEGHTVLQTWLTDQQTGIERGAYFVTVELLKD